MTEADTCRKFVVPWLQAAGWDTPPHLINEQRTFTDGRIIFTGGKARRGRQKRADYLLRYRPDFPIAVVEAKAAYRQAGDGLQQAKEYAEILGLKFAYATNGAEIIEFDYTTGIERTVAGFLEPDELWRRLRVAEGIDDDGVAEKLLTPTLPDRARPLRYYRRLPSTGRRRPCCKGPPDPAHALHRLREDRGRVPGVLEAVERALEPHRPATQTEDPVPGRPQRAGGRSMAKDFSPFGDARAKISGAAVRSRDMYFAIYQAIARDEQRPGLWHPTIRS